MNFYAHTSPPSFFGSGVSAVYRLREKEEREKKVSSIEESEVEKNYIPTQHLEWVLPFSRERGGGKKAVEVQFKGVYYP